MDGAVVLGCFLMCFRQLQRVWRNARDGWRSAQEVRDQLDRGLVCPLKVIEHDDQVDKLNEQLHHELTSFMIEDPHTITRSLNLMSVAHNLERVGDHATNIAEDIFYLYEARDIRHQRE